MNLFGVGLPEMGLVFVLALILVGPQRFPEIARQAGRWYRMARAFTDAVMVDVRAAVDEIEDELGVTEKAEDGTVRPIRELQDLRRDLADVIDETAQAHRNAAEAATINTPLAPPEADATAPAVESPDALDAPTAAAEREAGR